MHYLLALYMAWNTHKVLVTQTKTTTTTYATNADLVVKHLGSEAQPAIALLTKESGLNEYAVNKSSGAAGIAQALPFSKTGCTLADVECQIIWFRNYVHQRYGGAQQAWEHSLAYNWY